MAGFYFSDHGKKTMALLVHKYGGTSVGSLERINKVAEKVAAAKRSGDSIVVTVSAMSGETNRLVALSNGVTDKADPACMDVLLSTGEQVTIALLSMALQKLGCKAIPLTGSQAGIVTNSVHAKARIESIDEQRIQRWLDDNFIVVVAGFQGMDESGRITTLGRGGSDTTAVALAAALNADECQIYTDVDGVYTTDPRVEPKARKLDRITFEEMLEMASLGSKVLQIRSVEFASKYNVKLRVLSSFEEGEGTLIAEDEGEMEKALISGIAFSRDEAQLTVKSVPDTPGIAYRILDTVAAANIEVDMIVQNVGDDSLTDFTFTVHRNDYESTLAILNELNKELGAKKVSGVSTIVKVSLVGVGMRSHAGIASTMFGALAEEGINVLMISTSEIKISVVIEEKYLELAVRTLHETFELDQELKQS